ncbi:MAG: 30S ribosomal protein S2 [Candidatus Anstonellales archaeon]
MAEEEEGMLVSPDKYLEAGVHIGTKVRTGDMKRFVFKKRKDGIYIIDLKMIDERLRLAFNLLKNYKPEEVSVVATRTYSGNSALKAKELVGFDVITRRFHPGTFTNINSQSFREPKIIVVCDPKGEREALREAKMMNIPVIALVDTDNTSEFVDFIIPMNNKGRKSLALFFWLLTREMMVKNGTIKNYSEFKYPLSHFEKIEIEEEGE